MQIDHSVNYVNCLILVKGFRSEKSMRSPEGSLWRTSLAALSAAFFLRIPTCPGTHIKTLSFWSASYANETHETFHSSNMLLLCCLSLIEKECLHIFLFHSAENRHLLIVTTLSFEVWFHWALFKVRSNSQWLHIVYAWSFLTIVWYPLSVFRLGLLIWLACGLEHKKSFECVFICEVSCSFWDGPVRLISFTIDST